MKSYTSRVLDLAMSVGRRGRWGAVVLLALVPVMAVHADVIADWDLVATNTINAPPAAYPAGTDEEKRPNYALDLATVHLAMYDAVTSIVGGYKLYGPWPTTRTHGASQVAAVGAAACRVLFGLFPNRLPVYQAACAPYLENSPGNESFRQGLALGVEIAEGILAARANDGRMNDLTYVSTGAPGNFVPASLPPIGLNSPNVKPFTMTDAAQFRAPGPPALDSETFANDFNETRTLGGALGTGGTTVVTRNDVQSEQARFHTEPPGAFWPRNLRRFSSDTRSIADNARLTALLYLAQADVSIGCFESKYHYAFWRPRTAIPHGDTDGNPATEADPLWLPFVPTPNHPEYPAAHACVFGSVAQVLEDFFHTKKMNIVLDSTAFSAAPPAGDGTIHVHALTSTDQLVDESLARIYGGMHYHNSINDGTALGRSVGRWIDANYLVPLRHRRGDDHGKHKGHDKRGSNSHH
jgi:hypothetical protein